MTRHHPSVTRELCGNSITIDKEMAPIIDLLGGNGYQTNFCCQGDPYSKTSPYSTGYISMPWPDAIKLLNSIEFNKLLELITSLDTNSVRGTVVLRFDYSNLKHLTQFLLKELTAPIIVTRYLV